MANAPDGLRGPPPFAGTPPLMRHMSSNSTTSDHVPLPLPRPLPSNAGPGNIPQNFPLDPANQHQRPPDFRRHSLNPPPRHTPHKSWQAQSQSQIQPKPDDWPPYGMMAGPSAAANLHHNHYIPIPNNNGPSPTGPPPFGGRGPGVMGTGPVRGHEHAFASPTVAAHRPLVIPTSGPAAPAVSPLPSQSLSIPHQQPQRPPFTTSYSQPNLQNQESIRRTQHMMSMDWRHGFLLHPPDAPMPGPPRHPSTGLSRHPSNAARGVTSGSHSQGASRNSSPGGLRAAEARGRGGGPAGQGQESLARMALGMVGGGPGRDDSRERGRERERGRDGR